MSIAEITKYIATKSLQNVIPDHSEETESLMKRLLINQIKANNLLTKCTPDSIMSAAKEGLAFGLVPGRHFYLVPYGQEATCTYDYKGIQELCYRSPRLKLLQVTLVDKSDEFYIDAGKQEVHHIIRAEQSGETIAVYARGWLEGAPVPLIEYMPRKDIDACKNCAKSQATWNKWEGEMAKKSVLKRIMKHLPQLPPQIVQLITQETERNVTPQPAELPPETKDSETVPKDDKALEKALDEVKPDNVE